jgi:hypothetical protein
MPDRCWQGGLCDVVSFGSSFSDFDDDGWPDLLLIQDDGHSRLFWDDGEHVAHFGFGDLDGEAAHRVTIDWPSGRRSVLEDVPLRQLLVITELDP